MKKRYIVLIIAMGCVGLAWILVRVTNALAVYTMSANSNFPTIMQGERIYASSLLAPKRFDFIAFYTTTEQFGRTVYAQRLCGLPGDTIEMKAGDLYINGKFADEGLTLAHFYKLPLTELPKVKELLPAEEQDNPMIAGDSLLVNLADEDLRKLQLHGSKVISARSEKSEEIFSHYQKEMNADYFGPVLVPKDKYFVLGDNRSAAQDSRYLGFIDKSDYVATVLRNR